MINSQKQMHFPEKGLLQRGIWKRNTGVSHPARMETRSNHTSHQALSGRHGLAGHSVWKVLPLPLSLGNVLPTLDFNFLSMKRGVGSEDRRGPYRPTTSAQPLGHWARWSACESG